MNRVMNIKNKLEIDLVKRNKMIWHEKIMDKKIDTVLNHIFKKTKKMSVKKENCSN